MIRYHQFCYGIVTCLIAMTLGCHSPSSTTTVAPPKQESTAKQPTFRVASWKEIQAEIARHQGQVVVVDFWSNHCPPCIQELPGLAKLHEQYRDDVVCITVNCNYTGVGAPDEDAEMITRVLNDAKITTDNFVSSDADEDLYKHVGITAIPVVRVYDQTGALVKQFDNDTNAYGPTGFHYAEHITPVVAELLKKPTP